MATEVGPVPSGHGLLCLEGAQCPSLYGYMRRRAYEGAWSSAAVLVPSTQLSVPQPASNRQRGSVSVSLPQLYRQHTGLQ